MSASPSELAISLIREFSPTVDGIGQTADETGYMYVGYEGDEIVTGAFVAQNEYSTITKLMTAGSVAAKFQAICDKQEKAFQEYNARRIAAEGK